MIEEKAVDPVQVRLIRHFLAALSYRACGAIKACPDGYPDFRAGEGTRSPAEILAHTTYVLSYLRLELTGVARCRHEPAEWEENVRLLYEMLSEIDAALVAWTMLEEATLFMLLQGPLSDAMMHVGQLAMFRRLAGGYRCRVKILWRRISRRGDSGTRNSR